MGRQSLGDLLHVSIHYPGRDVLERIKANGILIIWFLCKKSMLGELYSDVKLRPTGFMSSFFFFFCAISAPVKVKYIATFRPNKVFVSVFYTVKF